MKSVSTLAQAWSGNAIKLTDHEASGGIEQIGVVLVVEELEVRIVLRRGRAKMRSWNKHAIKQPVIATCVPHATDDLCMVLVRWSGGVHVCGASNECKSGGWLLIGVFGCRTCTHTATMCHCYDPV